MLRHYSREGIDISQLHRWRSYYQSPDVVIDVVIDVAIVPLFDKARTRRPQGTRMFNFSVLKSARWQENTEPVCQLRGHVA